MGSWWAPGQYIRRRHPGALTDPALAKHFHNGMFSGFDFDNTLLYIGSINMQLIGVQSPNVTYRDSLAADHVATDPLFSFVSLEGSSTEGPARRSTVERARGSGTRARGCRPAPVDIQRLGADL